MAQDINRNGHEDSPSVPLSIRIPVELDTMIDRYHSQLSGQWLTEHGTTASRTDAVKSLLTAGLRHNGIERDTDEAAAAV